MMPAEAVRAIAGAHPLLHGVLSKLEASWAPDSVPPIMAMGDMGSAFSGALDTLTDVDIERVCDVVEHAMTEGMQEAADEVATGFLEGMLHSQVSYPHFRRIASRLGPKSIEYCRAWDRFTGVRTPGLWDD